MLPSPKQFAMSIKYLGNHLHHLGALALIVAAVSLRLALITQQWPLVNSDEATIGLMARHITNLGEHPIFFYGQHYMGSLEAYLAAFFFSLSTPSLFSLRLGLVLLFALFLLSTYLLTCLLYSTRWALLTLALLGPSSSFVLARQLSAIGGYAETLLFSSLSFLLACWLALSPHTVRRGWRLMAYLTWGLVTGLGLWSDLLILPFALLSFTLLLLCCRRELFSPLLCVALLGLLIGAFPLISYNLHAAPGQDSLSVLWQLRGGSHSLLSSLPSAFSNTIQVSLPMITGEPFCQVPDRLLPGPASLRSFPCVFIRGSWGLGYLLLLAAALILAAVVVLPSLRQLSSSHTPHPLLVRDCARLLLLGSALLTLLLYLFSSAPLDFPGSHSRYLLALLVATPAVLWPLWFSLYSHATGFQRALSVAALLAIGALLLAGTALTFGELPTAQAADRQQHDLIAHLSSLGVRHVYTDYWTCYRLAFLSSEELTCAVVGPDLQLSSTYNLYPPYVASTGSDPHTAYVFPRGLHSPTLEASSPSQFRRSVVNGYLIYQPVDATSSSG